jgi:EmrB/QacA subfamily drug resistance transporter
MSLFIVGLDNTIVNVALPDIQRQLHAPISGLQWIIDAYTLVLASLLMLSGSTADRIGRRRTFQTGLVLFTVGSLLCSLAPSLGWLVAFRMVQAVGGSMLNPVALSIVSNTFPDRRERAWAIGIWGSVFGMSLALGPVLGGVLVDSVGWPAIFWINIPVGAAALVLTARYVPESRAPHPRRVDPVGQLLILVALATLTYGIIEGPNRGWTSPVILGCFGLTAVAVAALLWYEPRRREPLLELGFFRSVPFAGATVTAICAFASLGGFLFLNTLYLQDARGFSALRTGLYTLPMAAMVAVFAPVSGRLTGSRGPRLPLVLAGVGLAISGTMLSTLDTHTGTGLLLLAYVIFGMSAGLVNPPITNTAVSGMPPAQGGLAAAVASTSRQVGQSLGVAVIGSAVTSAIRGPLPTGLPAASHVGWWIIAGCGVAVIGLGILTTTRWALGTATKVAERYPADPPKIAVGTP